jgi:hypothetical protein
LLPVFGNEGRLDVQRVNIRGHSQRDNVGILTRDDRSRLFSGAAVGLFDSDFVARLVLPERGKGGVYVLVKLTRRIVGNVQQGDRFGWRGRNRSQAEQRAKDVNETSNGGVLLETKL